MTSDPPALARQLDLIAHPEGGWYRQTWRSPVTMTPAGYAGERVTATGILYVLGPDEESMWHQVASDELWLHHRGVPLLLRVGGAGDELGEVRELILSSAVEQGHSPQVLVPAGHWQSARPLGSGSVLVSCVVSPGFEFADFRTGEHADL